MPFDICQMLNEIHHEDMKGTKKKAVRRFRRGRRWNRGFGLGGLVAISAVICGHLRIDVVFG